LAVDVDTRQGSDGYLHGWVWLGDRAEVGLPSEVSTASSIFTFSASYMRVGFVAYVIKDKAEAAYFRGDLFEVQRSLMETWSAYATSIDEYHYPHRALPTTRRTPSSVASCS
jgi:hypothetical protein